MTHLEVVGPADHGEEVNEQLGELKCGLGLLECIGKSVGTHVEHGRHLRGAVVLGEGVVVVVPTLAERRHRRPDRLCR